jgi:hypothetical protein
MVWKPVCTAAGKTRGNKCEAKCRGETIVREGECPGDASDGELRVTTEAAAKQGGGSGSNPPTQLVPSKASLTTESASGAQRKHETETVAAEGVPRSGDLAPMKPPRRVNCVCVALWAPVCGEDGNTYGNKCEAKCHGMRVAAEGECGTQDGGVSGSISSVARPGEGKGGGDGGARCAPDAVFEGTPSPSTLSVCLPPDTPPVVFTAGCNVCVKVWDPVCGKDGATYGNECEAVCRGRTAVAYKAACSKAGSSSSTSVISSTDKCVADCAASSVPVCGVDGKRYRSACAAKCHKIDVAYPGDCRGGE